METWVTLFIFMRFFCMPHCIIGPINMIVQCTCISIWTQSNELKNIYTKIVSFRWSHVSKWIQIHRFGLSGLVSKWIQIHHFGFSGITRLATCVYGNYHSFLSFPLHWYLSLALFWIWTCMNSEQTDKYTWQWHGNFYMYAWLNVKKTYLFAKFCRYRFDRTYHCERWRCLLTGLVEKSRKKYIIV